MGELFNIRDYQSKKKPEPKSIEETLAGIFEAALNDTAPCEYVAPEKDPA